MENETLPLSELKMFLIERKTKALTYESRSAGVVKATMIGQIQTIDAMLIYLNSKREKDDMNKLDLRLEEAMPIESDVDRVRGELARKLVELAAEVPYGQKRKISGVVGEQANVIYSKMWTLREKGVLPKHIAPMQQKNSAGQNEVYIAHKTPEQIAKMRSKVK